MVFRYKRRERAGRDADEKKPGMQPGFILSSLEGAGA
jgi:hypothetical protein